jgi:hypothetical protein
MKSEAWIRGKLQMNEDHCHKNKLTELNLEKLRDDYFPILDTISRDLVIWALYTGRIQILRKILELDEVNGKSKPLYPRPKMSVFANNKLYFYLVSRYFLILFLISFEAPIIFCHRYGIMGTRYSILDKEMI